MLLAFGASEASENVGPGTGPAGESAEQAPADERTGTWYGWRTGTWYGWQVFLADAASIGAIYVSLKHSGQAWLFDAGVGGYDVGGPIVRALHQDGAGWSLGRRLLLPLGGLLIGAAAGGGFGSGSRCSECYLASGAVTALVGAGVGMSVAMVYDWVTAQEPAPAVQREGSLTWAPVIVATRQMKGVGVALEF